MSGVLICGHWSYCLALVDTVSCLQDTMASCSLLSPGRDKWQVDISWYLVLLQLPRLFSWFRGNMKSTSHDSNTLPKWISPYSRLPSQTCCQSDGESFSSDRREQTEFQQFCFNIFTIKKVFVLHIAPTQWRSWRKILPLWKWVNLQFKSLTSIWVHISVISVNLPSTTSPHEIQFILAISPANFCRMRNELCIGCRFQFYLNIIIKYIEFIGLRTKLSDF